VTEEPDRDGDLIRRLGELPPPKVPADLAARIVRNVTQLPQQPAEAESVVPRKRARHWWPRAVGAAIAACAIGALLLHVAATPDRVAVAPVQVAQTETAVKVVTGPVEVRIAAASEAPATPQTTRKASRTAPLPRQKPAEPDIESSTAAVPLQAQAAPEFEPERLPPVVPSEEPVEHAIVGPTDPHGPVGPMPRAGTAPGFGISGSGAAPHY